MRLRRGVTFGLGAADQTVISAASFLVTLTAARALGATGLGALFLGFSAYLVALGLGRAFVVEPFVAASSAQEAGTRHEQARFALTLQLAGGVALSALLVVVGLAAPDPFGRGTLAFAPWLAPLLVQDLLRAILFQEARGKQAIALDAVWLALTVAWIPAGLHLATPLSVPIGWGLGCSVAALAALRLLRLTPARPGESARWWRRRAAALGKWLGAESVVYSVAAYGTTALLAGILGPAALGGLRAVQSALTPLSLLVPAFSLPGLPAVARALSLSDAAARRLATRIGLTAGTLAAAYTVCFGLGRDLLPIVFGDEFRSYASLVWPLGLGQLAAALVLGLALYLKAVGAGARLFTARAATAVLGLTLAASLGSRFGAAGAAWGLALAGSLGSLLTLALARPSSPAAGSARGDLSFPGRTFPRPSDP
jgi:O-antigen/teichoic acid export membrane protein